MLLSNKFSLSSLHEDALAMIGSFCNWQSLVRLSNTHKNAVQRMLQIWVRRLAEENLCFFMTLSKDRRVVHLNHITGIVSIHYQQNDVLPADFHPNPQMFHIERQISYNHTYMKYTVKSLSVSRKVKGVVQPASSKAEIAQFIKKAWCEYLIQAPKRGRRTYSPLPTCSFKGVYIQSIMEAIGNHSHCLFALLDAIRKIPLRRNGSPKACKQIVDHFKGIFGPDITCSSPDQEARKEYAQTFNDITNILLAYAAKCGNLKVASSLLSYCQDINVNLISRMPIYLQDHPLVQYISFDDQYTLPSFLTYAAFYGHKPVVELLIAKKAHVNAYYVSVSQYRPNPHNLVTALTCAIANDHIPVVALLLKHQADVNMEAVVRSKRPIATPLGKALCKGQTKIVQLLLEHQADLYLPSSIWRTDTFPQPDERRVSTDKNFSPLMLAIKCENSVFVNLLLNAKVDPNRCDPTELSPLTSAAESGHVPMMQALLASNAAVNMVSGRGKPSTALMAAARMHRLEAVRCLIDAKADTNLHPGNETALLSAIRGGEYLQSAKHATHEILSLLLSARAGANQCVLNQQTALMAAASRKDSRSVQVLLENRADCHAVDRQGHTALIFAVKSIGKDKDISPIVQQLILSKASVDVRDKSGKTPVDILRSRQSRKKEFEPVIDLLLGKKTTTAFTEGAEAVRSNVEDDNMPLNHSVKKNRVKKNKTIEASDGEDDVVLPHRAKKRKNAPVEGSDGEDHAPLARAVMSDVTPSLRPCGVSANLDDPDLTRALATRDPYQIALAVIRHVTQSLE